MADTYRCEVCGHTSDKPGDCCGQPMELLEAEEVS